MILLLISDDNYIHIIKKSIKHFRKIYPRSYIYLYDLGIKKTNINKLLLFSNLKIIDRKSNIIKLKNYKFSYQDNKFLKTISNSLFNKKNYFKFLLRKIIIKFKYPQFIYHSWLNLI